MRIPTRLAAAGVTGALLAAAVAGPAGAAPAPASGQTAEKPDKASAVEARRVDRVTAPKLDWYGCFGYAECATARLPLDYDNPTGATTQVALLRVRAKDQKHRIGSLFVNPGGPGGQGTAMAYAAPLFLSQSVLDRFDIVGVDPRGIGFSDNVRCFASLKDQAGVMKNLNVAFPYAKAQETGYVDSSRKLGRACSTTGRTLAGAMSTAEVARDMEVLRRSVGDKTLTYLGFSYGTALGQYYANMFPDRVRAVVVDGVINPNAWVGRKATEDMTLDDRLRSADGAYRALHEILVRCDKAGGKLCSFAGGDPIANFATVAKRLKAKPLVITDPQVGQVRVTYADFIGGVLSALYAPTGYLAVTDYAEQLYVLTEPPAGVSDAARARARAALAARIRAARATHPGRDFPYDNSIDAFTGVTCTDGLHPRDAGLWPALTARADARAPYFGRAWGWSDAFCARDTWTVRDEAAYLGPFTRRTSAPVLFVGDFWDPATNYQDAVSSSRLLPNSRLLSSDSWGHTAYGTSACVTDSVDAYLLRGTLPAKGEVCVGDVQPFAGPSSAAARGITPRSTRPSTDIEELAKHHPAPDAPKQLPPVVAPAPASTLDGTSR